MDTQSFTTKTIERFWKHVDICEPTQCWLWLASVNDKGYGTFYCIDCIVYAHRFSWILHNGSIPEINTYHGMCVLHKCDNPRCVNPDHLFLGTQSENIKDMDKKSRRGKSENTHKKLTPKQVEEIKEILSSSKHSSLRKIAKLYGVSHNAVWFIDKGLSYKE